MTLRHDKRAGTVTMNADLAFALLDAASFPPVIMKGAHTGIPRDRIAEIRTMLDAEGFDWRGVHNTIHARIAERAKAENTTPRRVRGA